jgi:predicted membrane protein
MDSESRRDDKEGGYAKRLEERIARDAKTSAWDWDGSRPRRSSGATPRLILGISIMVAGLLLALDNLGMVDASAVFRFWPVVLVGIGLAKLLGPEGQRKGGTFLIVLGGCLLAFTLGILNWPRLWAVLFIVVGGSIAARALRPPVRRPADPGVGIDTMALLGGSKTVSNSSDFRGGQALAVMGGCQIDLRKATIAQGEAVLDVFAFWGGIEIRVPEEWEVVNRVNAFLGGSDNKTLMERGARQRFVVTGTVIMGGVEVKN